jgi:aspartyl aminopeptidase
MRNKEADSLLKFIDASPTPYHAVENICASLNKKDAIVLKEDEDWKCKPGKTHYVVRNDSSIIAFKVPAKVNLKKTAFNMVAAHTDSPCLKLKPKTKANVANYLQWGVEIYGGILLNSWLDRDLHLAGRVSYLHKGELHHQLISITEHRFRVPQLAIHLDREVNKALTLNPETHLIPVLGLDTSDGSLEKLIVKKMGKKGLKFEDVTAFDLVFHEASPSAYGGLNDEFIYAPRIDNLAMSHAAVAALETCKAKEKISLIALFDHEEVGSESSNGACSNFLNTTLERIISSLGGDREDFMKAMPGSYLISADMAHAFHPNYQDRHDTVHRPLINKGPVVKTNARMRYATDSKSFSKFAMLCKKAKVEHQVFTGRNDIPCGSTVGPIVSTRLGVSTIDVGNPQLSMHSAREMAGSEDHGMMIKVFKELLAE